MAATYNELLPTDKDRARALLGDTNVWPESAALLTDEHITAVLAVQGSLAAGVAWLADELAARFAQQPTAVSSDGDSATWAARVDQWRQLATRMRAEAARAAQAGSSPLAFVPARFTAVTTTDEYGRLV